MTEEKPGWSTCDRCYLFGVFFGLIALGIVALVVGNIEMPVWVRGVIVVGALYVLWRGVIGFCTGKGISLAIPGVDASAMGRSAAAQGAAGAVASGAGAAAGSVSAAAAAVGSLEARQAGEEAEAKKAAAEKAVAEKAAASEAKKAAEAAAKAEAEAKVKAAEEAKVAAAAAEKAAAERAATANEAAAARVAEAARAQAAGEEDYDGDGVVEGTYEGTRPEALHGPRDGTADDLKRIRGVGPKLEKVCNSLGFYHFDQIAKWTSDEIAWVDANLEGFKGRVSRDDWVAQAKILAAGGETDFSKRVDDGDVPSSQ